MTWTSPAPTPIVGDVMRACLRFTLNPAASEWPIDQPLEPADWHALTDIAHRERVLGPLQAAIEGGLPVSNDQATDAASQHRNAMSTAAALEAMLPGSLEPFLAAGIDVLVVKGLATTHAVYPRPELRQFGDIDLLVHPRDFAETVSVMRRHWKFHTPPIGPSAAAVQKVVTATIGDGFELDVHQSVAWGPRWLMITSELFARARTISIGDTRALVMDPAGLLLHAAVVLQQPQSRLSTVLDIAHILHQAEFDQQHFADLVGKTAAGLIVQQAFERTQSWLPTIDLKFPPRATGTAMSQGRESMQSFLMRRKQLAMLLSASVVERRELPRLLRDLAVPSREWVATSQHEGRVGHLRRLPGYLLFGED